MFTLDSPWKCDKSDSFDLDNTQPIQCDSFSFLLRLFPKIHQTNILRYFFFFISVFFFVSCIFTVIVYASLICIHYFSLLCTISIPPPSKKSVTHAKHNVWARTHMIQETKTCSKTNYTPHKFGCFKFTHPFHARIYFMSFFCISLD